MRERNVQQGAPQQQYMTVCIINLCRLHQCHSWTLAWLLGADCVAECWLSMDREHSSRVLLPYIHTAATPRLSFIFQPFLIRLCTIPVPISGLPLPDAAATQSVCPLF